MFFLLYLWVDDEMNKLMTPHEYVVERYIKTHDFLTYKSNWERFIGRAAGTFKDKKYFDDRENLRFRRRVYKARK